MGSDRAQQPAEEGFDLLAARPLGGTTPVRLAHTPTRCRVVPVARIKHASVFAACAAADPGFVHFDVFVRATPDAILARADHSGAKLMEDLEGCLIAR